MSFSHKDMNCMAIWAKLRERGWFASLNTEPLALHLMLSPFHAEVADAYLAHLDWALNAARGSSAPTPTGLRYS